MFESVGSEKLSIYWKPWIRVPGQGQRIWPGLGKATAQCVAVHMFTNWYSSCIKAYTCMAVLQYVPYDSHAMSPSDPKVKVPPSGRIDRDAIDLNEDILQPVVLHLGMRVGVDVLETHLHSLYQMMGQSLSGASLPD